MGAPLGGEIYVSIRVTAPQVPGFRRPFGTLANRLLRHRKVERVMARVGEDPRPTLERARAILLECDARAFLFEVDDALAELDP